MNKKDLIRTTASRSGLTQSQVELALNGLIKVIIEAVSNDEDVVLVGFGTFSAKSRAARPYWNVSTGETKITPAQTVPHFQCGKGFKDAVKEAFVDQVPTTA
jgi:DNA-binding protein HU-beta